MTAVVLVFATACDNRTLEERRDDALAAGDSDSTVAAWLLLIAGVAVLSFGRRAMYPAVPLALLGIVFGALAVDHFDEASCLNEALGDLARFPSC